ncbi:poly [ADP-ribose] polymerase [Harmonia axyridis]|uniref:poly [ADP-ribose] polymerase n=1 Tax=Harmonia axyridis TaxID=115357 RepID=UPI001E27621E|nr:poly [ADP-ribose] polymerase [Harmonia axyridis]XP_045461902.1 poly [ADP-ribose] polymerase [Harmonia axyridis]XP_045461904.1 poly [ADP-ribose] polymerase [Harmonia axyridis]
MDLPYRAEYAKTGRAGCKGCNSPIGQGTLRIAVMVQSPVFDGKITKWYHEMCFFSKQRPKTVDDIENFETLRLPDQEKIREKIAAAGSVILPEKKGRGKKRDATAAALKNAALKDFLIEYSKSSRATCRGCELKIMKEEIRISKKDFETEVGKKYGGQDMWHHLSCFAKLRSDLRFYEAASALPGFKSLSKEDQKEALKQIPAIKQEDIPEEVKKPKLEEPTEEEKLYKEHLTVLYKYRDQLKKMTKGEMTDLLEYNDQEIPSGKDAILDRLADIMTFGALEPCKVCHGGQYVYNKLGYICHGDLTEWSKCNNITKTPARRPFKVPKELEKEYSFLKRYKYVPRTRIIKDVSPTGAVKKEDEADDKPRVEREAPALYNMQFVILGKPQRGKDELKKQITKLGGKVVTSINENIMAVIASEEDVEKMGSRMLDVRSKDIQVVPESFVDDAVGKAGKIPDLIIEKKICDWGSDPTTRLPPEPTSSKSKSSKSFYTKSGPSKVKLTVKGGTAVDPDSGLEKKAHVYQEDGDKYTVVLGIVDIQKQRNSYYKLQLLKSDKGDSYWVFRSWGRTGTTIGSNKVDSFASLHLAKSEFCRLYEEKSGNMWEDRHDFVKVPGKMYPIDIDYGEEEMKNIDVTDAPSNLEKGVSDLMRMIFDVKQMKQTMLELELDTEKMPLGKLSKKQILSAYGVLTELQKSLDSKNVQENKFIDGTNRFYTFIPHNFGVDNPPLLKTPEMIKQKIEMLDSLMELEVAYSLLKSAGSDSSLDHYYSKLNTEIKSIPKTSEEFELIQEYVKNTHAETHQSYELEILDLFDVKRQGEEKRFKPFKKLHNRMLLWHGSRTTNFGGILSQGLRIAPPEAPSTGYMFGKGIYFADMVSKSANYCFTSPGNNHGLMLLCEVALGNMHELTKAKYIEKLPSGKHSTKGLGKTAPDPKQSKKLEDVEVPLGKPIKISGLDGGHLLYNEYIVYDVAQVKAKYLVKLNFKYKY